MGRGRFFFDLMRDAGLDAPRGDGAEGDPFDQPDASPTDDGRTEQFALDELERPLVLLHTNRRSYGAPDWVARPVPFFHRSIAARRSHLASHHDSPELTSDRAKVFAELESENCEATGLRMCPIHSLWMDDDEVCPACSRGEKGARR